MNSDPFAHMPPRPVTGQAVHRRVVMGEFSAGKSTAINLMLRTLASPVSIGAQSRTMACLRSAGDPTHGMAGVDTRWLDLDGLRGLDLFELSAHALGDGSGLAEQVLDGAGSLVWCTIASQAWRNTERIAFEKVRRVYQGPATLAVTRADLLRSPGDRAKIAERLADEARPWFDRVVFIGLSAHRAALLGEDAIWHEAGGPDLQAALDAMQPAVPVPDPAPDLQPVDVDGLLYAANLLDSGAGENQSSSYTCGVDAPTAPPQHEDQDMNTNIDELQQITGFIGACMVDSDTGLMLASTGGGAAFDLEAAGAANTSVVKAKLTAISTLGLDDTIEDILITLGKQFHLIRPLANNPTVFLYLALDKRTANLGMARIQLKKVESTLEM